MGKLWFTGFKRKSGFSKDASIRENLIVMSKNTRLKTPEKVWLRVGRQAQALANLTIDKETKKKATAVARAAFKKLE